MGIGSGGVQKLTSVLGFGKIILLFLFLFFPRESEMGKTSVVAPFTRVCDGIGK